MHGKRFFWLGSALLALFGFAGFGSVAAENAARPVMSRTVAGAPAAAPAADDCGCSASPAPVSAKVMAKPRSASARQARAQWSAMPLQFEPNVGQAAGPVKYLARGSGFGLFLSGHEADLTLRHKSAHGRPGAPATLRMTLAGAVNPKAQAVGAEKMRGRINYLVGSDPKLWHTNVPTFRMVRYSQIYSGIDLLYYGSRGRLEYDFVVAPGASPHAIGLGFAGGGAPRVTKTGDLRLPIAGSTVGWHRPLAYQTISGKRKTIDARFALRGDGTVGFALGRYDTKLPLTIDPVLIYSTYLGGDGDEFAYGVAVVQTGALAGITYLTGDVTDLPAPRDQFTSFGSLTRVSVPRARPYQRNNGDGNNPANTPTDAFVAKIDTTKGGDGGLIYATYLGGKADDHARSIAVDSTGAAYIAGFTTSSNFPTVAGSADTTFGGGTDAFVTKLNPDGTALAYSTLIGGAGDDFAYGIAVDATNNADVVGSTTTGTAFKPTISATAIQTTLQGAGTADGFYVRLNPDGKGAAYSTYIGGTGDDTAFAVALDTTDNTVFITGKTTSTDLHPLSDNAFQTTITGTNPEAFVLAFDPTVPAANAISYFSYLGGSGTTYGNAIAVGPEQPTGDIYIVGSTTSGDYPVSPGAEQTTSGGGSDAFLTVIDPNASTGNQSLVYSTYIGGTGDDFGTGVAAQTNTNGFGNSVATITGYTNSINQADTVPSGTNNAFSPVGSGSAYQPDNASQSIDPSAPTFDAFMAQIDPGQQGPFSLTYLSFLGGSGDEIDPNAATNGGPGCAVAVGPQGALYVVGSTTSADDFPITTIDTGVDAFQQVGGGGSDAFLVKVTFAATLDDNTGLVIPNSSCGNSRINGTVTLNGAAPTGGTVINLTSDTPQGSRFLDPTTSQPITSVTIPQGFLTAPFVFIATGVTSVTPIRVTATDATQGTVKSSIVNIQPPALQTFQLNGAPTSTDPTPPTVGSGASVTGNIILSCPSNVGGQTVYLTSTDPTLAPVPTSVQVASLRKAAQFTFAAGAVLTATQVTITASETPGGPGLSVVLTVRPPVLVSLTATPNPATGGVPSTGTVTLDGTAGPNGAVVTLQSDNAAVSVPAAVTIPSGETMATFPITTQSVTSPVTATLTASFNGTTLHLQPFVVQPLSVISFTFNPTSVLSGGTSTGTVTVNRTAPAGGLVVALSSATSAVTVPGSVTIAEGQSTATFTAIAQPVLQTTPVLVTATINRNSQSATLTVTPQLVSSITATPSTVSGGGLITLTVTVAVPAPADGTTVRLSSTDSHVTVPAQLFLTSGKTTASIVIIAQGVDLTTTATLSAAYGNTPAKTTTVTVKGANVQSLTLAPSSVPGGGASTATLTLDSASPAGGVTAALSSSSSAATVPASVTVPAGATQVTFPVQSHPVSSTQSPSITASYNNSSGNAVLTVTPIVGGSFGSGIQLFSVPYDYPTLSLDTLFGYAGVKLAVYSPATVSASPYYAVTPTAPADRIRLGRGYWARFPHGVSVTQTGIPADTTQDFPLSLDAGWNQIGDPFLTPVTISALTVTAGDNTVSFATATTSTTGLVYGTLYRYPGGSGQAYVSLGSGDTLQPGIGYWIYTYSRVTLNFPHP